MQHSPVRRRFAVLAFAALAACSDTSSPTAAPATDPQVEQLVAMGARRDQIVDRGDHFVVEGDIRINKKDLRAARTGADPHGKVHPGAPSLQRYVSSVNRRVIRVDLSAVDAVNTSWASATRAAMSNWSAVPDSYVSFVEGGGPADITVRVVSTLGNCTVAQAWYPVAGGVGPTVEISQTYMHWYTPAKQVWIMTHELGHTLSLAHTDQSSFGTLVPGTPDGYDAWSVMNSGTTYGGCPPAAPNWGWFSSYDQVAMRYLYPIPVPTGLVATQSGGHVVLGWNAVQGASHYQVRRLERYTDGGLFGGGVSDYPTPWVVSYGPPFDTGSTWTGDSTCDRQAPYYGDSDYYYEVRAVFGTGYSETTAVPSQDSPC